MTVLRFDYEIAANADRIFSLLAQLRDYDRWLPRSSAFHGASSISDGPINVGTTYTEESPFGICRGVVTAYDPPTQLDFHQPMTLRPALLGWIDILVSHVLTQSGQITRVQRCIELSPGGLARLFMPIIACLFSVENRRMCDRLKIVAEAEAGQ